MLDVIKSNISNVFCSGFVEVGLFGQPDCTWLLATRCKVTFIKVVFKVYLEFQNVKIRIEVILAMPLSWLTGSHGSTMLITRCHVLKRTLLYYFILNGTIITMNIIVLKKTSMCVITSRAQSTMTFNKMINYSFKPNLTEKLTLEHTSAW